MKIVLRTVTGSTTELNVEVADTVQTIKQRMEEYDVTTLRLCHKGKVLDDAKSVEELGFKDGEVLIVAGKKKAVVAAVAAQSSSTTTTALPAPASTELTNNASPTPPAVPTSTPTTQTTTTEQPTMTTAEPTATTTEPAPAPTPAPTTTAAPDPYVDAGTVEMILMMGLTEDRAKVELALRCAYGNGDRAVDFLMNGIPPAVEAQARQAMQAPTQPPAPAPTTAPAPTSGGGGGGGGEGGEMTADQLGAMMAQMQEGGNQGGGSDLARALAGIPQFPQIAAVVRQNPSALPEVMRQLQTNFPDVFILVQANPQEFLDIVNSNEQPGGAGGSGGRPAPSGGAPGGAQRLVLTPEDAPAVERLVQLGGGQWDQRAAALVYLVANRNEEVAANLLFDHGGLPPELAEAAMAGEAAGGEDEPEGSS